MSQKVQDRIEGVNFTSIQDVLKDLPHPSTADEVMSADLDEGPATERDEPNDVDSTEDDDIDAANESDAADETDR